MLNHMKLLQSNVIQPNTKCYSLMWFISKLNVTLLCVSTNDQMIHSNVVPPIHKLCFILYISYKLIHYFRTEELNRGMSSGIITRSKAAQLNRFVYEIGIIWLPNGSFRNHTIGYG